MANSTAAAPRRRSRWGAIATLAVAGMFFGGCSSGATTVPSTATPVPSATPPVPSTATPAVSEAPSTVPTTVAFTPPDLTGKRFKLLFASGANMAKIPTVYAVQLMQKWGATTSVDYVDSQQIGMAAVLNGDADAVDGGPTDAIDGVLAGGKVELFALTQPRYDYIFTCKPSITSLSQLKGVTIGVVDNTGTNLEQAIIVMQKAGFTIKDATLIITGGQSSRVAALLSGRTDCTIVGYLNYLRVKAQGYTNLFNFMSDAPDLYYTASYTTPDWLSKNHDLAVAYNEAVLLSHRWVMDPANKGAVVKLTTDTVTGSDPAAVGQAYDAWLAAGIFPPNEILDDAALTSQMNQLVSIGVYKSAIPTSNYADVSFGQQALAAVGTAP
jgi:ABC-type nitrate/sulfonate/bicarbonate transport system substrate-binding protein